MPDGRPDFLAGLSDSVLDGKAVVIADLLYIGGYIRVGGPKIGKSFLVGQLSYHVSTEQPLLGYPIPQADVLYLALEDDEKWLQERMFRIFGGNRTDNLRFATQAGQVGEGLDNQLAFALEKFLVTRLVIVDTLQKVRKMTRPISMPDGFDGTVYPPGMESVPHRFAILKANRDVVDHADYLIAYVRHPASNARKLMEYAQRHEKRGTISVYNLFRTERQSDSFCKMMPE